MVYDDSTLLLIMMTYARRASLDTALRGYTKDWSVSGGVRGTSEDTSQINACGNATITALTGTPTHPSHPFHFILTLTPHQILPVPSSNLKGQRTLLEISLAKLINAAGPSATGKAESRRLSRQVLIGQVDAPFVPISPSLCAFASCFISFCLLGLPRLIPPGLCQKIYQVIPDHTSNGQIQLCCAWSF